MGDDKRLERIEQKLDSTNDHLSKIDVTLSAQHESLKEHIRRTGLIEDQLIPLNKHMNMVKGAGALIGLIGTIIAIYMTVKGK